jgi:hypothetical protein
VAVEFVGNDHSLVAGELLKYKPDACQALDASRIVVFGQQFGAFPYPADLMDAPSHGLGGDRQASCVLQRQD